MSSEAERPGNRVFKLNRRQRLAVWLVALLIKTLGRTWRFRLSPGAEQAALYSETPTLTILWHNTYMEGEWLKCYEKVLRYCREKGAWMTSGKRIMDMKLADNEQ